MIKVAKISFRVYKHDYRLLSMSIFASFGLISKVFPKFRNLLHAMQKPNKESVVFVPWKITYISLQQAARMFTDEPIWIVRLSPWLSNLGIFISLALS